MNVAGPSRRVPPGRLPRERVESTYEHDLLALVDQLSLDEMDEIQTFFTRRTDAGEPLSDHDLAMNDLLLQARALTAFNQDAELAQRIAAGEVDVGVGVVETPRVAAPRPNGHGTAIQQNENQQPPQARNLNAQATEPESQTWGGWFSSVADWFIGSQSESKPGPTNTTPTVTVPKPPVVNRRTGHDCVICQDPIFGVEIRAPCGHYYDIGCVTDLFQSSTKDETLYPPRCCRQNIPFVQVRPHLSEILVTTFQEKQAEFTTLKRVYCFSPPCSRFLGPLSEGIFAGKVYTCSAPNCGKRTCGKCRGEYADWTHACRPDADAAQVLELSRTSGWARCPGCSQMIELNIGCFHMTCRCRTEFCYLCRARWKTCRCPQWDERRLMVAAEERVNAQFGARGVRNDAPAQWLRPAPAPAPVFVPVHHPYHLPAAPAERRAQAAVPAPAPARPVTQATPVRQPPPPPPPLPARATPAPRLMPAVRPTLVPAPTPAPAARPVVPARPVVQASVIRPQPPSVRTTPTASSLTARPTYTAPTPTVTIRTPTTTFTSASASASTSKSPSISSPTTSTSTSHSKQSHWPKSAPNANTDPMRQRLVREMMERLRVDHECDHTGWRYRSGGGICQSCGHHLPLYLFRCQGCEMLACNRCRLNRL